MLSGKQMQRVVYLLNNSNHPTIQAIINAGTSSVRDGSTRAFL